MFAGHAWGENGANHEHVRVLVNELQSKGLEESFVYLAFICTDYLEKIDTAPERPGADWCEVEFTASHQHHGKQRTITVACEPALLNPKTWFGPVKTFFGGLLNIDYYTRAKAKSAAEEIKKRLKEMLDVV